MTPITTGSALKARQRSREQRLATAREQRLHLDPDQLAHEQRLDAGAQGIDRLLAKSSPLGRSPSRRGSTSRPSAELRPGRPCPGWIVASCHPARLRAQYGAHSANAPMLTATRARPSAPWGVNSLYAFGRTGRRVGTSSNNGEKPACIDLRFAKGPSRQVGPQCEPSAFSGPAGQAPRRGSVFVGRPPTCRIEACHRAPVGDDFRTRSRRLPCR